MDLTLEDKIALLEAAGGNIKHIGWVVPFWLVPAPATMCNNGIQKQCFKILGLEGIYTRNSKGRIVAVDKKKWNYDDE